MQAQRLEIGLMIQIDMITDKTQFSSIISKTHKEKIHSLIQLKQSKKLSN